MSKLRPVFLVLYSTIAFLFVLCAMALIGIGGYELINAVLPGERAATDRLRIVLETLAVGTVAVAALELGQTIIEEEVIREVQMSAPTRVRRFLSRFLVVVIVALSIESLVAVFHFTHTDPGKLPQAASVAAAAALLLASWGVFVRLNRSAEDVEPEALRDAKREDEKIG